MGVVEPDRFLTEVTRMFERSKEKGSVWITMKQSNLPKTPCKGKRPLGDPASYKCLVRATDGKKKFSTSVHGPQQARFQQSLVLIMKAQMDSLKRREKQKVKDDAKK